ncbi:hypothetical protein Rin_00009910, partial [Candidatus Regiella insecticola 5.15]
TADHLDLPMDFEHIGKAGSRLGTALAMAVDHQINMVSLTLANTKPKVAITVIKGATGKLPHKIINSPTKLPVPGIPRVAMAKNSDKACHG